MKLLCISVNLSYAHIWNTIVMSGLVSSDKLQLGIARQAAKTNSMTVGSSLAATLEPLAHCQNVTSLSLFYRYYFGRCSVELAQLVLLPFSRGSYSDRL